MPIYPRDLVGELYHGEWHDVVAKPLFASVEISKRGLRKATMELRAFAAERL